MKRFLLKVSIFCFFILTVSLVLDILVSHYLRQSKTYAAGEYPVWNDIYDGKINSEIVIHGSSRAVVQIDPAIIQKEWGKTSYNLGVDGNSIWLEYFRHQQFLQHNVKPRLIIHSLDVFMLSDSLDIFNSEQFLPYMLFNNQIRTLYGNNSRFSFLDFYVPMVRYIGNRVALLHAFKLMIKPEQQSAGRIKGYEAQDLEWNDDFQKAKLRMKSFEAPIENHSLQLFEKYLKECKEKNIDLVFVYTPEHIDGQNFVRNRKMILDLYLDLSRKYEIPYFDYSTDSISFDKSYFYNTGHLNKRGSELFTRKLASDLNVK
jgi:hypothetical protein